ncbi:VOC family protein [Pseudonocardia spinosispora]|uniref:VOC family protein n=1 Tax=Pseudonocardia spinosispora TaxID=103441 RepID=UPI00041ADFFD|nr:VOC family protein [Pseudonocardia spinosispora]
MDENAPSIYPTLRYADAPAAIRFLTDALGLTVDHVVEAADGTVPHATLSWGHGVVMISSRPSEPSPFDTGRACLYLAVADPDAAHDRAVAAGAQVVMGLTDQEYGSREFAVNDPEGNVWCFGTYQPAASRPAAP